jgi:HEAT repeat protein
MKNLALIIAGSLIIALIGMREMIGQEEPEASPEEIAAAEAAIIEAQRMPEPAPVEETEPALTLDSASMQRIRNATRDSNTIVRWQATKFLVAMEDDQAAPLLFSMLHRDADITNRKNVVSLLAEYDEPVVTQHLIRALKDTNAEVRLGVLDALAKLGDYAAAESIGGMIHDSNERVRLKAIRTLDSLEKLREKQIERAKEEHAEKMRQWEEDKQTSSQQKNSRSAE